MSKFERKIDTSIRIKVTNPCQWTCNFCHNEGTELPSTANRNSRVSVFLDPNVKSLPQVEDIVVNERTLARISALKGIGIDEVHLTGGEPTLHPELPKLVKGLKGLGFEVKMTTNGQAASARLQEIIEAGVGDINFSILSLDPAEFLRTQNPPNILGVTPLLWAERMIEREKRNILLAKSLGVNVKINTVVLGKDDHPRVDSVRDFAAGNGIKLVLLPSIGDFDNAESVVVDYAERIANYQGTTDYSNNSKGSRRYLMKDGVTPVDVKYLKPYHPGIVCEGCEHRGKSSCAEKFYGLRMEFRGGEPYIRMCVQKSNPSTVMPLTDFLERDINTRLTIV